MLKYSAMGSFQEAGPSHRIDDLDESSTDSDESTVVLRKTIMIGSEYQAKVPKDLAPYESDKSPYGDDTLLWEPEKLKEEEVIDYLDKAHSASYSSRKGVYSMPAGSHVRDDDEILFTLVKNGYNRENALKIYTSSLKDPVDAINLWSEEECRNFESGMRVYNKNFFLIQRNKVPTRSVAELVQFYYLWKKTERHDAFANEARLEKKKYNLHPGVTDYMDRLLDDAENNILSPENFSPLTYDLIYGDLRFPPKQLITPAENLPSTSAENDHPEMMDSAEP